MKKISIIAFGTMVLCLLFGCVTPDLHRTDAYGDSQIKDITAADLQNMLVKGVTTQTDVIEQLGNPSTMTSSGSGQDTWLYSYTESNMAQIAGDGLFGGTTYTTNANAKVLTILFKNGLVSDFYLNQSNMGPGTTTYELK